MPTASNTSPILNLAIIHRLDLLQRQFGEILVPPAVVSELKPGKLFPGADLIDQALQKGWLLRVEIKDAHLQNVLELELDDGEAAAIALALELGHDTILMDERDGRAKAKALGLEPIGILGVLLRARREGDLDSVRTAMESLRRDAGFFIDDHLFLAILTRAGEHK